MPEMLPPFATDTLIGCVIESRTVKRLVAVLPMESVAVTVWTPRDVAGTMKVALNAAVKSAVTIMGFVVRVVPSNFIVTVEDAAN